MSRLLRFFLYLLVIAPAVLCGYMIYHQVSLAKEQGAIDELKKHRGNLQSEYDSLSGKVKPLEELQSWEDRLKSKEKTLDERIKLAEEMETNVVIRMLMANEQVKSANAEVVNLEKTKGALEKTIVEKRNITEGLIDQISTTNQFLSRLEGRIETMGGQIEQKQSEYDNLDKSVKDLQTQRFGLDAKIRDLNKEYQALLEVVGFRISETNNLALAVAKLSNEVRALSDTNTALRVGVANLKGKTKDAETRLESSRVAAREACVAETNAILLRAKAESDLEVVCLDLQKKQAQLEGIKKQLNGLEPSVKELAELEEAIARRRGELEKIEGDLRVRNNELSHLEHKKEGLAKELAALSESEAKARNDLLAIATNFVNTITTTLDKAQKKTED